MSNPTTLTAPEGLTDYTFELLETLTPDQRARYLGADFAASAPELNAYLIYRYGTRRHTWYLAFGATPEGAITNSLNALNRDGKRVESIRWNSKRDTTPRPNPTAEDLLILNNL